MVALGQTVTIVNNSGKVVKTSKHLINIFKDAKSAYNERKAELGAQRRRDGPGGKEELDARREMEALNLDESSRRGYDNERATRRKPVASSRRTERPPVARGVSDSFYTNDSTVSGDTGRNSHQSSRLPYEMDEPRVGELTRRHTDGFLMRDAGRPPRTARSVSLDDIDMDLAYGELPPPLPERKFDTEVELRSKMSGLQRLLDECNCLQHSVTAIIDNLQKNPDALAAVALTLAEISNLVAKMAPGALVTMKGSFPAIIALLASPEFAIAAGVGVGVTIIALGGYKIIKKIKARKQTALLEDGREVEVEPETPPNEQEELRELNHVERWRRGVADIEVGSLGTTVDGEFVTPQATRTLLLEGKLTEADFKTSSASEGKRRRKRRSKSDRGSEGGSGSGSKSKSKSKSNVSSKSKAKKEPSLIKSLFKKDR